MYGGSPRLSIREAGRGTSHFFRLISYAVGIHVSSLSPFSHVACRVETKKSSPPSISRSAGSWLLYVVVAFCPWRISVYDFLEYLGDCGDNRLGLLPANRGVERGVLASLVPSAVCTSHCVPFSGLSFRLLCSPWFHYTGTAWRKCCDSAISIYTTQNGERLSPLPAPLPLPYMRFLPARRHMPARHAAAGGHPIRLRSVRQSSRLVAFRSLCRLSLRFLGSSAPRYSSRSVRERNDTAASVATARAANMVSQAPASNPCCDTVSNAANADTAAIPLAAPASMPLFVLLIAYHLRKCGIGGFHPLPVSFPRNRHGTVKRALNFR